MTQDKMRAEFEGYLIKDGFDTKDMKRHCDTYKYENVQFLWELWQAAQKREPLSEEKIDALPVWKHFVGLLPAHRMEIARTIEAAHNITKD